MKRDTGKERKRKYANTARSNIKLGTQIKDTKNYSLTCERIVNFDSLQMFFWLILSLI